MEEDKFGAHKETTTCKQGGVKLGSKVSGEDRCWRCVNEFCACRNQQGRQRQQENEAQAMDQWVEGWRDAGLIPAATDIFLMEAKTSGNVHVL